MLGLSMSQKPSIPSEFVAAWSPRWGLEITPVGDGYHLTVGTVNPDGEPYLLECRDDWSTFTRDMCDAAAWLRAQDQNEGQQ